MRDCWPGASVLIQKFLSTLSLDGDGTTAKPFDRREDILGGFGPAEGLGIGIAGIDIGGNGRLQLLDGAVRTALDLLLAEELGGTMMQNLADLFDEDASARPTALSRTTGRVAGRAR